MVFFFSSKCLVIFIIVCLQQYLLLGFLELRLLLLNPDDKLLPHIVFLLLQVDTQKLPLVFVRLLEALRFVVRVDIAETHLEHTKESVQTDQFCQMK